MSEPAATTPSGTVLTLGYLGQRTYLHGTTLLQQFTPHLADGEQIQFQCRKVIASDRVAVQSGLGPLPRAAHWHAWLTWQRGGAAQWIGVEPAEASPHPVREPYDESRLTRLAVRQGDTISLATDSPFPFITTLVSLNKFLLLAQPGERSAGQWLFTGLKLRRYPPHSLPLQLTIRRLLANLAARTAITLDEDPLGEMEFVWHTQNLHTAPPA